MDSFKANFKKLRETVTNQINNKEIVLIVWETKKTQLKLTSHVYCIICGQRIYQKAFLN